MKLYPLQTGALQSLNGFLPSKRSAAGIFGAFFSISSSVGKPPFKTNLWGLWNFTSELYRIEKNNAYYLWKVNIFFFSFQLYFWLLLPFIQDGHKLVEQQEWCIMHIYITKIWKYRYDSETHKVYLFLQMWDVAALRYTVTNTLISKSVLSICMWTRSHQ